MAMDIGTYMNQKAAPWVSTVLLVGCVLITLVLVYSAIQAKLIAVRLTGSFEISTIE